MKEAKRIQASLLNETEKKVLIALARRQPHWMTSDILTYIGAFGALVFAAGFILSRYSIHWLWLSSLGMVINWYGDSLDGTLARFRNLQRPVYGYYLDHTVDCINEVMMFIGIGLSGMMHLSLALLALVLYLLLTVNVSINAHLKGEFKLTYGKLGPTEFRLLVILFDTLLILLPGIRKFSWQGLSALDLFAALVNVILAVMYLVTIVSDARYYASVDPINKDGEAS